MARILIVDDSPTEIYVLQKIMQKHGYETLVANDGEEGIMMARAEHPDVILMDVVMPGMSGFQATRKLSKDSQTASIPILMVTTKDQDTDRIWALRQGAIDYVVKPVHEAELIRKIKAVVEN
ncbi:MAG: response regulator [Pseudomonadota bacterium]|nr:response regulator [Pseudomonadota bacterium]